MIAVIGFVLLLLGAGGYLLWRYQPWRSEAGPTVTESRFPLVEYTDERFETRPVVPPGTAPESSGPVEIGPGAAEAAALSDGTSVGFPGLGDGDRLQVALEREAGDPALNIEGIQATGSARVLTLESVQLSNPAQAFARLIPRIVIPAREAGQLAPETILLARQGQRVIEGQGVAERVDLLPVVRDSEGNLVAMDIWLPYSPVAQGLPGSITRVPGARLVRPVRPVPHSRDGRPPAGPIHARVRRRAGGRPVQPEGRQVRRRLLPAEHQLEPQAPARPDGAAFEQPRPPAAPLQAHQVGAGPGTGEAGPERIRPGPWPQRDGEVRPRHPRRRFRTPGGTHTSGTFGPTSTSSTKPTTKRCSDLPFSSSSFTPRSGRCFQGDGPTADFFHQLIREQLKKQLNLKQSFNLFIVAHSMGGIVSRAGVQNFDGGLADNFRHLATWGTPHLGSPLVSLAYLLISPYHKYEITGPDISGDWRKTLLSSVLITDNPGTMDLRWTNGNAGYRSELVFDKMGFIPDAEAIRKRFKSEAEADPVINLRTGSFLYNENLSRLNASDKYSGTDKYIFLYGITAKGVKLEWTGGVFDKGFEAEAVYQQSEIGKGATTLWLLIENPKTPYLGVQQGESDGAVPILSMTGHGLGAKTVSLGECDHEEYFGAPDSPGNFTVKGKASVTTRTTLSNLGIGSVERYNPPEIRLKLRREEDVKALLAGDLDGDLEIEGELAWPGDANPSQRIQPDKIEASVGPEGQPGRRSGRDPQPVGGRAAAGSGPESM